MNYSNVEQKCDFAIKEGWEIAEVIHGSTDSIGKCDGAIYFLKKK
jgi:hypothetical protein